jgi:diguanylate cyclase (GGDEF)-like protein
MYKDYKVLIVDDETTNLILLSSILTPDFTVLTAKSGEEALTRTHEEKPDIILLDVILGDINGFTVLERLKKSPETNSIPVMMITGLASENDELSGLFLGAVDYITKPFRNEVVRLRVTLQIKTLHYIRTIEKLGLIEPLTELANRRCFDDRLELEWRRAIREQSQISFLMLDIDNFKHFNDTYGHPLGDTLLQSAARIFKASARRPSELSARLGGEEFGILLPNIGKEEALIVAEKIRKDVEALRIHTKDGAAAGTTISIGVTTIIPTNGDNSKEFVSKADENLYKAKTLGRNVVFAG